MDVRRTERDVKTAYADAIATGVAPDQIVLRFGLRQPDNRVAMSHSIALHPVTALRLSLILRQAMAQYQFRDAPAAARRQPGEGTILRLMEGISEQARRPLALAAGLGVGYALTGSFKMLEHSLLGNRYLMTLAKDRLGGQADARILEACRGLGMPQELLAPFAERLKGANYVHFGFEEAGRSCLYKVYMEYWSSWKEELEVKRRSEPFVGGYGYKWDPQGGRHSALTRYTCHPLLPLDALMGRIAKLCELAPSAKPVEIARGLLEAAARRIPAETKMLYLEADEEGNPRRSFDVNMLQAKVLLAELHPLWLRMCEHYGIELEAFHALFTPIRNEVFAHIQGGVDREGRDFITIYYGSEAH
jgi:hypothetical protein